MSGISAAALFDVRRDSHGGPSRSGRSRQRARAGVRGATTGAAIASNGLMPSVWRLSTRPRRVSASGAATAPARDAIARWVHAFNERELEGMLAGQFEIAPFCAPHRSVDGLIVTAHHYLPDPKGSAWSHDRAHLPRKRLAQRAPRLRGGGPRGLRRGEPVIDRASARSARCRRCGRVVLCGYVDGHGCVAWLRGRSRGVRP